MGSGVYDTAQLDRLSSAKVQVFYASKILEIFSIPASPRYSTKHPDWRVLIGLQNRVAFGKCCGFRHPVTAHWQLKANYLRERCAHECTL